ncbi:MFS transporter [Actinoplanes sp. TRM 88003]|uniref:MFS transporter n=1 Tax=Paractinoplanes aksuensis TaxID=2939490 RepID=A0ABT1DSW1_9ACTN|nr:MFS transporter [Actinoplanes aksuensis]MCO8273922.1 MFS transporter [Actinoplanes aksuensis]
MSVATDPPAVEPLPPLRRNRDFRLLWLGAGAALLGARASAVAYPLLMIWEHGSPGAAGLVAAAALLPNLLVQLPAGVLVDRWDRRRIMITCDVIGLVTMLSVVAALLAGHLWLWHLMIAAFVEGSAGILYRLSERAAVRHVVPAAQLPAALSHNEARGQAAGLAGQPVGSGLIALIRWGPFAFAAVAHAVSLVTLLFIRRRFQADRARGDRSIRRELAEGVRWVWKQRFMRTAVGVLAASNLLFQVISLSMLLILKEGGSSPAAVGIIGLLSGGGGVLGAMTGSWLIRRLSPVRLLAGALALWGLLTAPMAVTDHPVAIGGLFAAMSFAGALLNVAATVYQVQITPDELQGRVTSVFAVIGSGMNSAGAALGGVLLVALGVTTTVLGVAAAMAVLAIGALLSPAIRAGSRELVEANAAMDGR